MREEARARSAALALVIEDRVGDAVNRVIEIGVGKHDRRRLAAKFERDALQVPGRSLDDELADFRRAGEGDLVDIGMVGECSARRLTESCHDVDDAIGNAGFGNQLAETQRRERRLLRRLENDRAARGERRRKLPCGHHQRKIPRYDLTDDADRLTQGVGVPIARA